MKMRSDTSTATRNDEIEQVDARVASTLRDLIRVIARQAAREVFKATSTAASETVAPACQPAVSDHSRD
ncbi:MULTISPECIES: hypothetical protein [Acidiphilium]|uniref:hypothetical protein n=1 Tax=Acidiphilium TaxID=522 RepID=UPI00049428D7|nr:MULTISPECIES: hypothetical protein [Acidiphilium]